MTRCHVVAQNCMYSYQSCQEDAWKFIELAYSFCIIPVTSLARRISQQTQKVRKKFFERYKTPTNQTKTFLKCFYYIRCLLGCLEA